MDMGQRGDSSHDTIQSAVAVDNALSLFGEMPALLDEHTLFVLVPVSHFSLVMNFLRTITRRIPTPAADASLQSFKLI